MIRRREAHGKLKRTTNQHLIRWVLSHFQVSPLGLQLDHSSYQEISVSNRMFESSFYTSCLEFDAHGVLLVSGSSNGLLALYDFDEYFHKSLNMVQQHHQVEKSFCRSNSTISSQENRNEAVLTAASIKSYIEPVSWMCTRNRSDHHEVYYMLRLTYTRVFLNRFIVFSRVWRSKKCDGIPLVRMKLRVASQIGTKFIFLIFRNSHPNRIVFSKAQVVLQVATVMWFSSKRLL
jgi:hypothetical protein